MMFCKFSMILKPLQKISNALADYRGYIDARIAKKTCSIVGHVSSNYIAHYIIIKL